MSIFDKLFNRMGYKKTEQKMAGFMEAEIQDQPTKTVESGKIVEYRDFIDAFRQLPWLYAAAVAVAVASTKPELKIFKEMSGEDEEVEGEDINLLLKRPNPFLSQRELRQITIINAIVTGEAYWYLAAAGKPPLTAENPPKEIWWIKPEQMEIQPHPTRFIEKYIYKTNINRPKDLDISEVVHFKLPNPDSYFRGLGMLQPAKNAAILEFNSVAYNKGYLENNATPPFYFWTPENVTLTDKQRKEHRESWQQSHKGPKKAGNFGYCWGGMEIKTIGNTPKDAQYVEMRKMNREEILACVGVPPSVVGLLEYANYSNMEVQQKKFWQDAVIPIMDLIADKLTLNLAPLFDPAYRFEFDYSDIKVLQRDEAEKSQIAERLVASGIKTPNQIRREMYNEEPYEGGDRYWMKFGLTEVGIDPDAAKSTKPPKKTLPPKKEDNKKAGFWGSRKKILWDNFMKRLKVKEGPFADKVEEYLVEQAKKIKKKLDGLKDEDIQHLKSTDLFNEDREEAAYSDKFYQRYVNAVVEAGEAGISASKGILYDPDMKNIYKQDAWEHFEFTEELDAQVKKIVAGAAQKITSTTAKEILALIEKARVENWTVEELTQEMIGKFPDMPRPLFSPARARTIATTEMANAENFGQLEGYKQNPNVEKKGWLCSFLPTSREAHQEADHRYSAEPIYLYEMFEVGGDLLDYPGAASGSPENIINCYCTTFPVVPEV